jgi:hypothetical protein
MYRLVLYPGDGEFLVSELGWNASRLTRVWLVFMS